MSYKSTCSPQSPCQSPSWRTTNHVRQPWGSNNTQKKTPPPPQKPPNKLGYGATIKIFLKTLTLNSNFVTFAECVLLGFLLKRLCIGMLEPFGGLHPATPDFWTTAPPSHKRNMLIPLKSLQKRSSLICSRNIKHTFKYDLCGNTVNIWSLIGLIYTSVSAIVAFLQTFWPVLETLERFSWLKC